MIPRKFGSSAGGPRANELLRLCRGRIALLLCLVFLMLSCNVRQGPPKRFWEGVRPASGETERLLRNARYLKTAGRLELALKELEEAHQRDPHNFKILDTLAQAYEELGEWERAEELYLAGLALDEGNPSLANNLCFSYYLAGKFDRAESCFQEALKNHAHNSMLRNNLGLVLARQGRQEEAFRLWREAEGEAVARRRLNQALAALGLAPHPAVAKQLHLADAQPAAPSAPLAASAPAPLESAGPHRNSAPPRQRASAPGAQMASAPKESEGDSAPAPLEQRAQNSGPKVSAEVPAAEELLTLAKVKEEALAVSKYLDNEPVEAKKTPDAPEAKAQEKQANHNESTPNSPFEIINQKRVESQAGGAPLTPTPGMSPASAASQPWPRRLPILTAQELFYTKIQILNGNGIRHLARRNRSWLELEGFDKIRIGNFMHFKQERTVIHYRPEADRVAQVLGAKFLRTENVILNQNLSQAVQVRIVLGQDLLQKEDILAKLAD